MTVVAGQVSRQFPEMKDWSVQLVDFYHFFVNPQLQTALVVLLCAVGCVLLIASGQRREPAAGASGVAAEGNCGTNGAGREPAGRLLRQLLVESLVLSTVGGSAGLLAALWAVDAIDTVMPANLLPVPDVRIDATVLLFAFALTMVDRAAVRHRARLARGEDRLERKSSSRRRARRAARGRGCATALPRRARAGDDSADRGRPPFSEPRAACST